MYKHWAVAFAWVGMGGILLQASPLYHPENKALQARLAHSILADFQAAETPYQYYQKQLSAIEQPSYKNLQHLFERLSVYNAKFINSQTQQERAQLAGMLAQETWSGWNHYRPIGMIEIFDRYFPVENKDSQIALLEYHIKNNLLSAEQRQALASLDRTDETFVNKFKQSYQAFTQTLRTMPAYQPQDIVNAFIPVINAYDQLLEKAPKSASLVRSSAFIQPIAAGWGRTVTVEQLHYALGAQEMTEGYWVYSAEQLQQHYGVSKQTAETFAQFVAGYYK